MIKIEDLSIADLYEAWRLDGNVWVTTWAKDRVAIRFDAPTLKKEMLRRGVKMPEASAIWKEAFITGRR